MSERLLSANEVSEYLGVPRATLYRWRYVGSGPPAFLVGRHLRYPEAGLRAWLDERV